MKFQAISLLTLLVVLQGCNSNEKHSEERNAHSIVSEAVSASSSSQDFSFATHSEKNTVVKNNVKKKIIKEGTISAKTSDIIKSKSKFDLILTKWKAYYEREEFFNNDHELSYNLKIRVPAPDFESIVQSIESGVDEITNKNVQLNDVTEEYIDLETRIASKRDYLNRYRALLSKAHTVKDILSIEENIRVLLEEIEVTEGRLKYLGDQVDYSTLTVFIFQKKDFIFKPEQKDKFSERVKLSLRNGWNAIVTFVLTLISIWPLIIVAILIIFLIRIFRKRWKKGSISPKS